MDLWIKTQNKENLVKVNNQVGLKYSDKKTIIANYIPDFSDNYDGSYDFLGTYKTKEDALDVLDEIDWFKEQMIMYEHQTGEYKERIRLFLENKGHTLGTFYMPKD